MSTTNQNQTKESTVQKVSTALDFYEDFKQFFPSVIHVIKFKEMVKGLVADKLLDDNQFDAEETDVYRKGILQLQLIQDKLYKGSTT